MIRVTRSAVIDAPIERVWALLRDSNSHAAWHPAVARSEIEDGAPPDQVGCVRSFELADGHRIREQRLALSDREHVSTYCILDASLPLDRYVATVQLKRVTDGEAHVLALAVDVRLAEAAEAHRALEGRRTVGPVVLLP